MTARHSISLPVAEAARLAALERLCCGALHTLNNALTAIGGEASFLLDDAKPDPAVVEACQAVLAQVERCGRLTHRLLSQRDGSGDAGAELDLVRVAVELRALLVETLGARVQLALEAPQEPLVVKGARETLELLIVSLVHHAAEGARGSVELTLALGGDSGGPYLELRVAAGALDEDVADAVLDPHLAASPVARARLQGIALAAAALGARCWAERTSPGSWSARLRFAA